MNRTYKVNNENDIYQKDTFVTSNKVITDFLEKCEPHEDADLLGWLYVSRETDCQSEAVEFIADAWCIDLEEVA